MSNLIPPEKLNISFKICYDCKLIYPLAPKGFTECLNCHTRFKYSDLLALVKVYPDNLQECPECHKPLEDFEFAVVPITVNPETGYTAKILVPTKYFDVLQVLSQVHAKLIKKQQDLIEFLRDENRKLQEMIPPKTLKMATCLECGKEFYAKNAGRSKYCSSTCRVRAYYKRHKVNNEAPL